MSADRTELARTAPDLIDWPATPPQWRRHEQVWLVGQGTRLWRRASADVMRWKIKTRSGSEVLPDGVVEVGDRPIVTTRMFGVFVREPVEVIAVVREPHRVGFAYRTGPGHPICGEEAFILHHEGDDVRLTVRSLTRRSSSRRWSLLYPMLLAARSSATRRYARALR